MEQSMKHHDFGAIHETPYRASRNSDVQHANINRLIACTKHFESTKKFEVPKAITERYSEGLNRKNIVKA